MLDINIQYSDFDSKICVAAARLENAATGMKVTECDTRLFVGKPGVVVEDGNFVRFAAIRVTKDSFEFPPFDDASTEELHRPVENYIANNRSRFENKELYFDIIDFVIMADDKASARRAANALELSTSDIDKSFEKRFVDDLKSRLDAGQDVAQGNVRENKGKIEYTGSFD